MKKYIIFSMVFSVLYGSEEQLDEVSQQKFWNQWEPVKDSIDYTHSDFILNREEKGFPIISKHYESLDDPFDYDDYISLSKDEIAAISPYLIYNIINFNSKEISQLYIIYNTIARRGMNLCNKLISMKNRIQTVNTLRKHNFNLVILEVCLWPRERDKIRPIIEFFKNAYNSLPDKAFERAKQEELLNEVVDEIEKRLTEEITNNIEQHLRVIKQPWLRLLTEHYVRNCFFGYSRKKI